MDKQIKSLHIDMHDHTALLESLQWDEEKLLKLHEYLYSVSSEFALKHPTQVLLQVEITFGSETAKLLGEIFSKHLAKNNNPGDDNET